MVLTGFVLIGFAGAGVFFSFQFAESECELKQWQIRLGIVGDSRFADIDGQLGKLTVLAENGSLRIYTGILIEAKDRDMPSLEADSLNPLLGAVAKRAGLKAENKGSEIQANFKRVGVAGIGILDRDGNSLVSSPGMPPNEGQLKASDENATIWRYNGTGAMFRSYGVEDDGDAPNRDALADRLPPAHRAFFDGLRMSYIEGDYLIVHAGLRPGLRLDRQTGEDMMWIRQPFLDSTENWGYTVVHGHSAVSSPEIRGKRIGLDTGAVWSGCLTAMVLTDTARDVLQT